MVKAWNVKKKEWEEVEPIKFPEYSPLPSSDLEGMNLEDLKKLVKLAKEKGWI